MILGQNLTEQSSIEVPGTRVFSNYRAVFVSSSFRSQLSPSWAAASLSWVIDGDDFFDAKSALSTMLFWPISDGSPS
jgi:hypothetical protein